MKRSLLVFWLSCLLLIPGFLSAQAENETGLTEMGLSADVLDGSVWFGAEGAGAVLITGEIDDPPQLTCPDDDSVHASYTLVSTDFSVADLDGDSVTVTFLDINPPAMVSPTIVDSHVEWRTFLSEHGNYVIRLVATDPSGLEDTCGFTVTVYNRPPELTCPNDDSVHAGETFVSSDFLAFDPDGDFISVGILDINPASTNYPSIAGSHVEWVTTGNEGGDYVIRLVVSEICIPVDTCEFTVYVEEATDVGDRTDNPNSPKSFALLQNQPNPFNPETQIIYYLPRSCQVKFNIYNILGQKIRTLFDGYQSTGMQTLLWDGRDDDGVELSSGIYFYRLEADDFHQMKKMTLLK